METLNAEQIVIEIQSIIKALKVNNGWWENRGRGGWFNHDILVDAVAVITSQEQRIKELTEENERLRADNKMVAKRTVRKFVKMLKSHDCRCDSCINEIKKEIENEQGDFV